MAYLDIQKVINYLNGNKWRHEEDYKNHSHFVVVALGDEFKVTVGGQFEPLTANNDFFADIEANFSWLFGSKKEGEKEEESKHMIDAALFWFTYYLDRGSSYYGDLYTLLYYVPSVAFTFSLRAIRDVQEVARRHHIDIKYYGELFYDKPRQERPVSAGEEGRLLWFPAVIPELERPEQVFGWVISSENFPRDAAEAEKIENAYNELVLNSVGHFGQEADEILKLIQKIREVRDPEEIDRTTRELVTKVNSAEAKLADALNNIARESMKFMYRSPVHVVTPQ